MRLLASRFIECPREFGHTSFNISNERRIGIQAVAFVTFSVRHIVKPEQLELRRRDE